MKRKIIHYFDYAATTPMRAEVLAAMKPYFSERFGNPSNIDSMGREARAAVENSLGQISSVLNCRPTEFVFTGSATEADVLAILGTARANRIQDIASPEFKGKIIISNVEHKGIISTCKVLAKEGFEIVEVKVKQDGLIYAEDLLKLIDEKTILISITSADNETGTIQPIAKLVKAIKRQAASGKIIFHTDASQVASYLDLDVQKLGVDLMTLSAHKIYGPKGIGGLFVRRGTAIQPIIFGGGQQSGLRSGTENVPGIVGFGKALELAAAERTVQSARVAKLRDRLAKGIFEKIEKVLLNGHLTERLPNFLNVSILDIEGEAAILRLDALGIIANTGSACNSQSLEPSHILTALGRPYEISHGSIRFTLGKYNTDADVNFVLKKLSEVVKKLRQISPLNLKLDSQKNISEPKAFVENKFPHFLNKKK